MRYSNTTNGFYPENREYPDLPTDLIDVTPEEHKAAINRNMDTEMLDVTTASWLSCRSLRQRWPN